MEPPHLELPGNLGVVIKHQDVHGQVRALRAQRGAPLDGRRLHSEVLQKMSALGAVPHLQDTEHPFQPGCVVEEFNPGG